MMKVHKTPLLSLLSKPQKIILSLATASLLLSGCGGGGSGTTPPPVNQAPLITSASSFSVAENQTGAFTVTATDDSTITYSIEGTDASSFAINPTSGVVTFNTAPDYETKTSYSVTVKATDSSNNSSTQNVTVNITDINERVFKTGQTTSYTNYDDGYYASTVGIERNFTRDETKEIVTDNVTKLEWQDDVTASTTTANWATATTSTCQNLNLGGYGNWRLPTIEELETIVNYGAVPSKYTEFQNMVFSDYWSSTTYAGNTDGAWVVYFNDGYDDWDDKTNGYYVRCVRAGQ